MIYKKNSWLIFEYKIILKIGRGPIMCYVYILFYFGKNDIYVLFIEL